MKLALFSRSLSALALWLAASGAIFAVESLQTSRLLDSGTLSTTSTSFVTVRSITNSATNTGDVVALASFSGHPGGGQGQAVGHWRLTSGAQVGKITVRDMSDSSNDFGIINLAWTFTNLAPGAAINLEHRSPSGKTIRTSKITLVVIPMTTASNAVTLKHHQDSSQAGFGFSTSSTAFVPVEKSAGALLRVTVPVDFVQVPKNILIAAVATALTPGSSPVDGFWKLEFNEQGSPPPTPCQNGTAVGTQIRRSLSGVNDNGAIVVYAIAEGLAAGTYDVRLCARTNNAAQAVETRDATLLAFGLSYAAFPGGYFPHLQTTTASATVSNASIDPIPGLMKDFDLAGAANVFLALSSTVLTTASGSGDFAEFETCIENRSTGAYPFGRNNNGNSQEVRRFFSSSNDFGVGGQVGLALSLAAGQYRARGCGLVTGNPVTFQNPNLVGFVPTSLDDPTVPVTLASFQARNGARATFEWSTATEVGNLGFHLYAVGDDGLRRLNDELIPSLADSVEPQYYSFESRQSEGELFLIEDVDLFGRSTFHGPFSIDVGYGSDAGQARPIAWGQIRHAHAVERERRAQQHGRHRSPHLGGFPEATLRVDRDGLYRVRYEGLLGAGVDLGGAPLEHLALSSRGEPVPIRVEGRGRFGPGAFVEFVGEALDTPYTDINVYTLRVDHAAALRVGRERRPPHRASSTPAYYMASVKVEQNRVYHFASPTGDPWYDARLLAVSGPIEADFDLELDGYQPSAAPVRVDVSVWGVTDYPQRPDHHLVVDVNGVEMAEEWFDGLTARQVSFEVPSSLIMPSGNRLGLRLPHDSGAPVDLAHYDHYRVTYPRRFVASEDRLRFEAAGDAFRVEGLSSRDLVVYRSAAEGLDLVERVDVEAEPGGYSARFVGDGFPATYYLSTVSRLLVPEIEPMRRPAEITGREADLVILSHADFIPGLDRLVEARRAEGFTVAVVDVEDVYARFGHGIFDPEAIRIYLAYAHAEMGTEFVLLVGGDSYDYRDYLGLGSMSFVPSLYAPIGPIVRFAPVDPLFGDIDGDDMPEMAIGRLPVRTAADLQSVIDKTLDYSRVGHGGTAVFAADAFEAVTATSFSDLSDGFIARLPANWLVERAYVDDGGLDNARRILLDGINDGVGLTSYFGHSGPNVWSFQGLFRTRDALELENAGRPTVITQWGCWNTYHVSPTYDTLGHAFLLAGDRGAAAVLGAATLTTIASEQRLGAEFMPRLTTPGITIGEALRDAKRALGTASPELKDVILGWTLLGDPTLRVVP